MVLPVPLDAHQQNVRFDNLGKDPSAFSHCSSWGNPIRLRRWMVYFTDKARGKPCRVWAWSSPASVLLQGHFLFQSLNHWGYSVADSLNIMWTSPRVGRWSSMCTRQPHNDAAQWEVGLLAPSQRTLGMWAALLWQKSVSVAWTKFCRATWPWASS